MGIYIKGMDMPAMPEIMKQAEKVPYIDVRVFADGTAVTSKSERPYITQYSVISVPPHGRLIDADALMHEFEKAERTMEQHGQEYSCSFMSSGQEISTEWYCVEDMLENAPTIIPAEEGET